jgi:hypothetical protein
MKLVRNFRQVQLIISKKLLHALNFMVDNKMLYVNPLYRGKQKAIGEGRVIFENIRKFIVFLLSYNMSEIFVATFAGFLNVVNPLLPLQTFLSTSSPMYFLHLY